MMFTTSQQQVRYLRGLVGRRAQQIGARADVVWQALGACFALTFRPGDRTSTFAGKTLRPLGAAVAVTLSYEKEGLRPVLSGLRADLRSNGFVDYGASGRREFQHEVRTSARVRGQGALSVERNPSLVELMLQMDKFCERSAEGWMPFVPRLPRILLGFAPEQVPAFEVTPALRRTAAQRIGLSEPRLAANPALLVERLLVQTWESVLIGADDASNPTGLTLIDAEYCSNGARALRAFEDFRGLIGVQTWNPANALDLFHAPNPTAELLAGHGIEAGSGWQESIDGAQVEALVGALRQTLDGDAVRFSDEDLFDGLIEPAAPLTAVSESLPRLRKRLSPYWSECTTDDDLRSAARHPQQALFASGACRVQVLRRRSGSEPLCFTSEELRRRVELDCRPIVWQARPCAESGSEGVDEHELVAV